MCPTYPSIVRIMCAALGPKGSPVAISGSSYVNTKLCTIHTMDIPKFIMKKASFQVQNAVNSLHIIRETVNQPHQTGILPHLIVLEDGRRPYPEIYYRDQSSQSKPVD